MSVGMNTVFSHQSFPVEKTIEVEAPIGGQYRPVRIEALRMLSQGTYSTRVSILEKCDVPAHLPPEG